MVKIHKAVIAAAGLGTRFLPFTKSMPKEMLPLGNIPIIQHIVEGLVKAGVKQIVIVGGPQKRAIENHFDPSIELEQALAQKGKLKEVESIRKVPQLANFIYMGQKGEPAGNARPLLNAVEAGFISEHEEEPFFFMFADDFFEFGTEVSHAQQLINVYQKTRKSVISLTKVEPEKASIYGMVDLGREVHKDIFEIKSIVEKPGKKNRPSDFATVSGYLLNPEIISFVKKLKPSKNGEIVMAEAIGQMAEQGKVVGALIHDEWHDAGNPTSYAIAIIDYALKNPHSAKEVRSYLSKRLKM